MCGSEIAYHDGEADESNITTGTGVSYASEVSMVCTYAGADIVVDGVR